jgi:hypothetical protein
MEESHMEHMQAINKPDGTFIQRLDKQLFIVDIFFNHNTKDTIEDKFLRVILAEEKKLQMQKGGA